MNQALQSFITSYLLGCSNKRIVNNKLVLHDRYTIDIEYLSYTGFHTYSENIQDNGNSISFLDLVKGLASLEDINEDNLNLFCHRVEASALNQLNLTESRKNLLEKFSQLKDFSFKTTEQTLVSGHYSHPYPKLLEGELETDFVNEEMQLQWCLIHKDILHIEKSPSFDIDLQKELSLLSGLDHYQDFILFPFHPYQFESLQQTEWMKNYLSKSLITKAESQYRMWTPTTSLRTLYNQHSNWMLKFSLNVRLTNSIRILQSNEVKRGMQLHEVFNSQEKLTTLQILHEPAYLALKNEQGEILKETIVVLRDSPFKNVDEKIISLATLNPVVTSVIKQIASLEGRSYVETAHRWFTAFLEKAVFPFVYLQAQHGIYLGAHQQNLILKLDECFNPVQSFFRDCQGTGYSQMGFEKFKANVSTLNTPNGNVLPIEFANTLMGYYLFINTTLYTIKSIAQGNQELEIELIKLFNAGIQKLDNIKDSSFIDYVLNSKTFFIKDNYECCVKNINENTMNNPLDIYKQFDNPFYKVKHETI